MDFLEVLQLAGARAGDPVTCGGPSAPPKTRSSASPRAGPALPAPSRRGAPGPGGRRPWRSPAGMRGGGPASGGQRRAGGGARAARARPTVLAVSAAPQPPLRGRREGAGRERAYAAGRGDHPGQPAGFWGPRPARRPRAQVVTDAEGPGSPDTPGLRGLLSVESPAGKGVLFAPRRVIRPLGTAAARARARVGAVMNGRLLQVVGLESEDENAGSSLPRGSCAPGIRSLGARLPGRRVSGQTGRHRSALVPALVLCGRAAGWLELHQPYLVEQVDSERSPRQETHFSWELQKAVQLAMLFVSPGVGPTCACRRGI
ncbi:collagen alpha-1(I) chain-like [Mustela putorius furo]|uniref:Collagen alpha-1(I) chain-like n=1 Tax=Mustela putorius furo TaxID=9669 RepID=A0A8U0SLJ2_MUSPF|nr:collagen alpha-1(I) chain-like [Mustela putorius furo]